MKEKYLCKNLSLSIWVEYTPSADLVKIELADLPWGTPEPRKVEVTAELGKYTPNRSYHLREAIVIALRRVVSQAMTDNLISVSRGLSATSTSTIRRGDARNIILSIDPES